MILILVLVVVIILTRKLTDFGLSLMVAPSESGVGEFDADPFIVSPAFLDLPILKVFIV